MCHCQINLLMEKSPGGDTLTRYLMTLDLDGLIAIERGETVAYAHRDGLGSLTALSDVVGNVVERYAYDPFGVPQSSILHRQPAFAGRPYDPALDAYDLRFRIYDPHLGRFLQRDPLGLTQGLNPLLGRDPLVEELPVSGRLNLYAYADNSPVNLTDPFGLLSDDEIQSAIEKAAKVGEIGKELLKEMLKRGGNWVEALSNRLSPSAGAALVGVLQTLASKQGAEAGWGVARLVNYVRAEQHLVDELFNRGRKKPYIVRPYFNDRLQTGFAVLNAVFGGGKKKSRPRGCNYKRSVRPRRTIPFGPGNDYMDDTFSVASSQFPAAGSTGLTLSFPPLVGGEQGGVGTAVPRYRCTPRIALLWNGFPEEAAAFLNALGEPYDVLDVDFAPAVAALYPVLLIPSGGLYGLEGSASFRARLEAYVAQGGVTLVSSQQKGYEFSALPGGLGGYGWTEDQSCFNASVTFPQYHQALSGFHRESLDVLVDGYFSIYPTDTISLLDRDKNGYPAALLYPYPPPGSPPLGGGTGGVRHSHHHLRRLGQQQLPIHPRRPPRLA